MRYISKLFIKKLLYNTNIIDIISSKINLKKNGKYYQSICPFHNEKNPSFIVNEDKKFFYCFGCKIYGNIIDFLMKFNNYNFLDAIKELANISNSEIVYSNIKTNIKDIDERNIFFQLMALLNSFYKKSLLKNFSKIKYFFKIRNINYKLIKYFSLGYSDKNSFNKFIQYLDVYKKDFLFKLGVLKKNKYNNYYDILDKRITFPIYNIYGNIIAFGARIIYLNNYNNKYINISNNIYFNKKKCLYNLFNLIQYYKKNNIKISEILIVEGYLDVILLFKYEIISIGLLGTNISIYQINILYKYTNKLIFCLDGDKAGYKAVKNIVKLLLNFINSIKICFFVFLPSGEDPDSLIQKEGKILFRNRIKNALSIWDVLFSKYMGFKNNLLSYFDKISFLNFILPLVKNIKCPITKSFIRQSISNKVGIINNDFLEKYLYIRKKSPILKFSIIRCLISLVLKFPFLSYKVNIYSIFFKDYKIVPGLLLFLDIINLCISNKNISSNEILNKYNNKNNIRFLLIKLLYWNFFPKNVNFSLLFDDNLKKLKYLIINIKLKNMFFKKNINELSLVDKIKVWNFIKMKKLNLNL